MRYLILSDLHAGLEAFEQCLILAAGSYGQAVCLGDLVGYGPDPAAVIDRLRQHTSFVIRGNHDKACCGLLDAEDFNPWARIATLWTRSTLSEEHTDFLRGLPAGPMTLAGFQMVHGSGQNEDQYVIDLEEALPALQGQLSPLVFFGHTHTQGGFALDPSGDLWRITTDREIDGCVFTLRLDEDTRYLINPGSVGQPRDGNWRAAFAIYDDVERRVEFYRTRYPLAKTQAKMAQAGLPEVLIRRLETGR